MEVSPDYEYDMEIKNTRSNEEEEKSVEPPLQIFEEFRPKSNVKFAFTDRKPSERTINDLSLTFGGQKDCKSDKRPRKKNKLSYPP